MTIFFSCLLSSGCASIGAVLGDPPLNTPPEFNQEIILDVSDDVQMFQAPRGQYDPGDLQSFHTQHTLPILVEDAFHEMFGKVTVRKGGTGIETGRPDVPAVFEVRLLDVANDIYMEADNYRGEVVLAVAMKSPRGHIFWQKAFRGKGYARTDPQFGSHLGPQDALADAMRNALDQMQQAIVNAPEVRTQMRYYQQADQARSQTEAAS